jgi:H+/Cl- antiporter ClcA
MRSREFLRLIANALLMGLALAFLALAFLAALKAGGDSWYHQKSNGWFDGKVWWVGVTIAAGVVVGLLHRILRMPPYEPGLIKEMQAELVEPDDVPRVVAVSLVSLIAGASLGPEQALGAMGGGFGTGLSRRQGASEDGQKTTALTGMSAAYGGLLSSPVLASMLVVELARPPGERHLKALIGGLLAASVAFAVYVPIAGEPFVGVFSVPQYAYRDWHLLAGVGLGLLGAVVALTIVLSVGLMRRLTAPLEPRPVLRSAFGGLVYGLIGVTLPLTLFTGNDQLPDILNDGKALGIGLVLGVLIGKVLAFSVCQSTGFIGGPFLPSMFMGGTAGVAVNLIFPDVPLGLTFSCLLVAVPGALVGIPFTLVLLAVLMTNAGALQSAPIAIAAVTSYLAVSGSGILTALQERAGGSAQSA